MHVGIRGPLYAAKDLSDDGILGFQVVRSDDYQLDGLAGVVERVRTRLADGPVYVSIDIDVLDPAHAPGTGTPEAGGLTSRELLHTLRALVGTNVVGADIVEVAPAYDHAEITGIAAAHVAYELLAVAQPPGGAVVTRNGGAPQRWRGGRDAGRARRRHRLRHPGHPQPGALPLFRRVRDPAGDPAARAGRGLRRRRLCAGLGAAPAWS